MHTVSLWVLFSTLLSLQHVSGSVLANRAPTANKLSSSNLDTEGCSSYSATAGPHRVNLGVRQESGEDDEEGISECEELFQMDHALDEKEQQQLISGNYAGLNCVYIYAEVLNYLESVFKEHLPNALPKGLNGRDDKAGSTSKCEQARALLQKQEESQPCHQIKDLNFVFALADEKWAGTYDYVGATIQGPAGKATLAIGDAPSRGFEAVMPVDMKASFGADIIDMDGINKITLTAQGHFWTLLPFKNDQWKVKGISLRAQCASPGFNATNDELSELNAWFGHPGGWGWKPLLETDVATFDVTAAAWSTAPPCAIIKALNYEFHVGDTGALGVAGADGSLLLALGEGKKITLGVDVSRGYSKTDAINLKDTFGSETVDIRNIKKMALLHEGGNDQWLLDGITFTATCADKPKQMKLEKFGSQNEWITTSSWDRNDIGPQDWREIKA